MFRKRPSKPQIRVGTLIGVGTVINGNIAATAGLRIDGRVTGDVTVAAGEEGLLVIGEQARLEGTASAPRMVVNGSVAGTLIAGESLKLQPQARIAGELHYGSLEASRGAIVEGLLLPTGERSEAAEAVHHAKVMVAR